jgi:hypothetical protein
MPPRSLSLLNLDFEWPMHFLVPAAAIRQPRLLDLSVISSFQGDELRDVRRPVTS